jgi:hypothetical protein
VEFSIPLASLPDFSEDAVVLAYTAPEIGRRDFAPDGGGIRVRDRQLALKLRFA